MPVLLVIALLLLLEPASCGDIVASNISGNMMYQLSEILSLEECHSFYARITGQEENDELELEQVSEGNNLIHSHKRRAITNTEQCRKSLSHWLDSKGDCMCLEYPAETLQAIGHSDVSLELLGKNLNQEKNLETEKDMEKNHTMVETSSLHLENKTPEQEQLQDREITKILSDPGNSEQLTLLKTKSPPPYSLSWLNASTFLLVMFLSFTWDIMIMLLLNYLRRLF